MYKLHALQIIFKQCLIELCVFWAGSSGRGEPGHQGGPGWVTNQPNQSGPGHQGSLSLFLSILNTLCNSNAPRQNFRN